MSSNKYVTLSLYFTLSPKKSPVKRYAEQLLIRGKTL